MTGPAEPIDPVNPDHDHEPSSQGPGSDDDLTEVPVDPTDSLKREGEDDMPGLDPTPPTIPPD